MKLADVDPFIGTQPADLPEPRGIAASWWWPKPQIGNTHPGATFPLGMVSACAYSGAYPTGYGEYDLATEGVPPRLRDRPVASGITHFQQSGTGGVLTPPDPFMLNEARALQRRFATATDVPLTVPLDRAGNVRH